MSDLPSSNRRLLSEHLRDATARSIVELVGDATDPDEIAAIVKTAAETRIAELGGAVGDADARVD